MVYVWSLIRLFVLIITDTDNEYISFSSDEEQTEALGFVTDGIFKVYIKGTGDTLSIILIVLMMIDILWPLCAQDRLNGPCLHVNYV